MFDPRAIKVDRVLKYERQLVCCRFTPDRAYLLAAGYDGLLHRWKLDGDQHEAFPAHKGWVETMVLHPDGKRFLTADSWGQVHCWPLTGAKMTPLWTIARAQASWLRRLAVSPDGKYVATCGNDHLARVFDAADGKALHELRGHTSHVMSVAFHPDGHTLATGDLFGTVKQWDLRTDKCVRDLQALRLYKKFHQYDQGGIRVMTFDPPGKVLYCGGFEGSNANQAQGLPTVVPIDWQSGKVLTVMTPQADFKGPIIDLIYHPAGYLIGAGSSEGGGALWFWKPGQEKESHLVKYAFSFRGLGLHGDGVHLAAAAFGDAGGQRGGNGRRLNPKGEYPDFEGSLVLYTFGS
jgi:hypothetical protein